MQKTFVRVIILKKDLLFVNFYPKLINRICEVICYNYSIL